MILYRGLMALGLLLALAAALLLIWTLATEPGNGDAVALTLAMAAWAGGVVAGALALARRGRPVLASLVLLLVVVPGVLGAGGLAWLAVVGFGPHH